MTQISDQELRDLVKQNALQIKELKEENKKGFQELREAQKTDAQLAKTDAQLAKTDAQLAETAKQLKETDTRLRNFLGGYGDVATDVSIIELRARLRKFLGGYGDTAEEYFYQSLKKTMRLGDIKFDEIDREVRKKADWNEFDIVLYNGDSVGIIEVKSRANPKYLEVEKQIHNFKEQFPEYQGYKIYYGVATMSTKNNELYDFCKSKGLFLLCQNGDHIDLLNSEVQVY